MSVPPRPAATTILVRPAVAGFEVFMLRRSSRSAFMPDVYVFPGGTLDAGDYSEHALARVRGIDEVRAPALFRDEPGAGAHAFAVALDPCQRIGLIVTAARELYEEAGVLLAMQADGSRLEFGADHANSAHLETMRSTVASGGVPFAQLLEEMEAWIDARAFIYFSHWITPAAEPRRFDAYFFLAVARADERARADASETHDGIWIAPERALERAAAGTFSLRFPTIEHLKRLVGYASIAALLEFARTKRIVAVMPEVAPGKRFLIDELAALGW